MVGTLSVYVLGRTIDISDCLLKKFALWTWQFWLISVCGCTLLICVEGSGKVSTVWKVFRLTGMNIWMQIPPERSCSILMFYWFWALKPLRYHWVFCAWSLNGLCKSIELGASIFHAHSSFPFPIWDKILQMIPYSGKWLFLMEAISALFICQSVWSAGLQR